MGDWTLTANRGGYDVPNGSYLARFTGVTLKDFKGKLGANGKPLPPAMTWDFVIVEGVEAGRRVDRMTGRTPVPRSACANMLAAIASQPLKDGAVIELAFYIEKLYEVIVKGNRVCDIPGPVRVYGQVG